MKSKAEVMKDLGKVKNTQITLQNKSSEKDDIGGRSGEWQDVATIWARKRNPRQSNKVAIGGVVEVVSQEFEIWPRRDVKRGWRILVENQILKVAHIYQYDPETLILVCEEVSH